MVLLLLLWGSMLLPSTTTIQVMLILMMLISMPLFYRTYLVGAGVGAVGHPLELPAVWFFQD